MKRVVDCIAVFLALAAVWELAVRSGRWSPVLLPSPISVAEYVWAALLDGTLLEATLVTLKRLLLGYAVGVLIGLPIGLLTSSSQIMEDTFGSLALGLQTLPSVCWVPLALVWFGQAKVRCCSWLSWGRSGRSSSRRIMALAPSRRSMPVRPARWGRRVCINGLESILPASLPFLVSGMKQGWAFAWRSLMAAEIYVTILTGFGLGHLLHYGRELNAMEQVIGVMLVIVVIGLVADRLLFSPWERLLHARWGTNVK